MRLCGRCNSLSGEGGFWSFYSIRMSLLFLVVGYSSIGDFYRISVVIDEALVICLLCSFCDSVGLGLSKLCPNHLVLVLVEVEGSGYFSSWFLLW